MDIRAYKHDKTKALKINPTVAVIANVRHSKCRAQGTHSWLSGDADMLTQSVLYLTLDFSCMFSMNNLRGDFSRKTVPLNFFFHIFFIYRLRKVISHKQNHNTAQQISYETMYKTMKA